MKLLESMQKQNALYEQVIAGLLPTKRKNKVGNRRNVLKFTKKEISQMPAKYAGAFAVNELVVYYRLKQRGVYEARYHKGGIHIEVSSKDVKVLKEKFIEKLKQYEESSKEKQRDPNVKTFKEYADEWLNIKRVTTKESTYREYVRMLERDILPVFGEQYVTEIDRSALQSHLMSYIDRGVLRMVHKIHLMLKCIFDMVADDYNIPSPMRKVVVPRHEGKHGQALTYEEEKNLVKYCLSTLTKDASHAYLVLMYAGLRRSELASINVIDGTWLECETSKERMGKNVVKRKIPFTPMMKRLLPYIDFEKAKKAHF